MTDRLLVRNNLINLPQCLSGFQFFWTLRLTWQWAARVSKASWTSAGLSLLSSTWTTAWCTRSATPQWTATSGRYGAYFNDLHDPADMLEVGQQVGWTVGSHTNLYWWLEDCFAGGGGTSQLRADPERPAARSRVQGTSTGKAGRD